MMTTTGVTSMAVSGNGCAIEKLRIVVSGTISVVAISSATVLLATGHDIPTAFWLITSIAVAGVAGSQVVQSIFKKGD